MFTDVMPDVRSSKQVTVMRAKAGKPIVGYLAGYPVRTLSHWWKGRTLPCVKTETADCPLCKAGSNQRYYAYYPLRGKLGGIALAEMTATAEAQLVDFLRNDPGNAVALVKLSRNGGKRNNPVIINVEWKPCSEKERASFISKSIDQDLIQRSLARLWNLPEWPEGMGNEEFTTISRNYIESIVNGLITQD